MLVRDWQLYLHFIRTQATADIARRVAARNTKRIIMTRTVTKATRYDVLEAIEASRSTISFPFFIVHIIRVPLSPFPPRYLGTIYYYTVVFVQTLFPGNETGLPTYIPTNKESLCRHRMSPIPALCFCTEKNSG